MKLTSFLLFFLLLLAPWFTTSAVADERKVIPSIALQQEYNDNLNFSSQTRVKDFITTVSPALELRNKTERLQAGMKMQLDSSYYHDNQSLNSIDHNYSGNVSYALSPKANLFTSAGYRRDSRVDRDFKETGFLLGAITRDRYNYRLGGDYALSEVMGARLQYSFDSDYYENSAYSDSQSHDISFMLSRDFSKYISRTIGRINLGMTKFDSESSAATNYTGTIGAERSLDERFSFFADVGLRYTQSTVAATQMAPYEESDGSGLIGRAGVFYKGELHNATLSLSRGVMAASGRNGNVERTALDCSVERRLNETSRLSFATGYVINRSTQNNLAAVTIDERSLWLQPKILYDLTDQFAVEASYNYALITNRVADTDTDRNLILLRLVCQYPMFE